MRLRYRPDGARLLLRFEDDPDDETRLFVAYSGEGDRKGLRTRTLVISESGIASRADVERAQHAGAQAVLVGEAIIRAPDPGAKIRELLGLPSSATAETSSRSGSHA